MSGYCTIPDVEALNAGRPLTATSIPNATQAAGFIVQTAAELDGILGGMGVAAPVPTTAPLSYGLLKHFNSLGAHCLVEESAPTSQRKDQARELWEAAKNALRVGEIRLPDAPDLPGAEPRAQPARTPYFAATQAGYGVTLQW